LFEKKLSSEERIRLLAQALDDAVEVGDRQAVMNFFAEDAEIVLFGIKLCGSDEIQRAIDWMFDHLGDIEFQPITIMIEGGVFFEEFIWKASTPDGKEIELDAAEVLVYVDDKIKSLRIYADRMVLAQVLAKGLIEKTLLKKLDKLSLKGLVA
jgi:ketosteroid isomerase-like protein